ncbi:MAG: hypothetical protein KF734_01635 [Saprospiraceae bacterium]|nr:hypothetical protein [Saprospiraceae bacterium]
MKNKLLLGFGVQNHLALTICRPAIMQTINGRLTSHGLFEKWSNIY